MADEPQDEPTVIEQWPPEIPPGAVPVKMVAMPENLYEALPNPGFYKNTSFVVPRED